MYRKNEKFIARKENGIEFSRELKSLFGDQGSVTMDSFNDDASEIFFTLMLPFTPIRIGYQTLFKAEAKNSLRSINSKIKKCIKKYDEQGLTLGWAVVDKPRIQYDRFRVPLGYKNQCYKIKVFFA